MAGHRALVGREAETASLRSWLVDRRTAPADTPPAMFISGEAGVGKSALVDAVLDGLLDVHRGAAVPWAPQPYALLAPILPTGSDPAEVAERWPGSLGAPPGPDAPVVVLLEDLQWADDASLALLPALVAAVAPHPLAVIATYRSDELPRDHPVRRVRAQLRHARLLGELTLGPLDVEDTGRLLEVLLDGRPPTARLRDAVADRTEGVPFFVEELLAALAAGDRLVYGPDEVDAVLGDALPLPETVRDAVLLRVADLPEPSRHALEVAAVLAVTSPSVDPDVVAALVAGGWPDELDESGVVLTEPGCGRRFRHDLVREAVHSVIPWSRRRALHLAVADLLERRGRSASEVAAHLVAGHDILRARSALVRAAGEHLAARAYRNAGRLLRDALEDWPVGDDDAARLAAVGELARAAELSGDHLIAVRCLEELLAAGEAPAAELHRRLAIQHALLGRWPRALTDRERAAAAFAADGLAEEAAAERLVAATHLRSAGSFRAALEALDRARPDAEAAGRLDLVTRIDGLRGNVLVRSGRADEGLPLVRGALDVALAHGLASPAAEVYQRLADSLEHVADYRAASHAYDSALEFCELHGQDLLGQVCRACATVVMFQGGRWDQAIALCHQVREEPRTTAHAQAVAGCVSGLIAALRGQSRAARSLLLDGRATAERIELVPCELLATWGLSLLDELAGSAVRAADGYRVALARCAQTEERHYSVPVLQFGVVAFARVGAAEDLAAATTVLAEAAARRGDPEPALAFAAALGETTLLQEQPEEAVVHLRRALDLLEGLELPVIDVLVRHRLGAALRATGPEGCDEALSVLAGAVRTARRLKARLLVERLTDELERLGSRAAPDRPGGLTAREEQVVRAVGEGLTDRQIAERLFLSVRTVEMHVRNARQKLGSRTRAEAVQRLTADSQR